MFVEAEDGNLINLDQVSMIRVEELRDPFGWGVMALFTGETLFTGTEDECHHFLLAIIEALESGARVARFEHLRT
jgi:hypothetical protein